MSNPTASNQAAPKNTITRTDPTGAEITVTEQKGAGAFDLRNVIGALLGIYGLVLLIAYFVLDPGVDASTGEPKVAEYNLWTGLALVVAAVVFFAWAKFNPIKVETPVENTAANTATNTATEAK